MLFVLLAYLSRIFYFLNNFALAYACRRFYLIADTNNLRVHSLHVLFATISYIFAYIYLYVLPRIYMHLLCAVYSACSLKIYSTLCHKDNASFRTRFAPLPWQTFISLVFEFRKFPWVQSRAHSHLSFVSFSLCTLIAKYLWVVLRLYACIYVSIYRVFCCCSHCAAASCLLILCVVYALILCFVLVPFTRSVGFGCFSNPSSF